MINCHFVWPAIHMPERGRETRLVPVALSSFISIREVYHLWFALCTKTYDSRERVQPPLGKILTGLTKPSEHHS